MAVSAIVSAMADEMSLRATSWASAEPARPQANAAASESSAIRNAVLDIVLLLDDGRADCGLSKIVSVALDWSLERGLLQVGGHLVDAGLGASFVLFAAGRAGHPNRADRLVADLNRQRALRRGDVGQKECAGIRVAFDALGEFAGRPREGARRIRLLHRVFERGKAGVLVTHSEQHLTLAAQHVHGYVISLRLAGIDRRPRDRGRHGKG